MSKEPQPVYCPLCEKLGYKDMPSNRLGFNLKTRKAQFQCNWHPDHKFELPLEEYKDER